MVGEKKEVGEVRSQRRRYSLRQIQFGEVWRVL